MSTETPKKKTRRLTKKQLGFTKDFIETGNGTEAALRNYDVEDENTAAVIASQNLRKPAIAEAIAEALPDDLLAQRHLELLNKREVIRTPQGDMVTDQPDTQAVKAALDMAYKIKGTYAPEKRLTGHFDIDNDDRDKATKALRGALD